MKSYLLSTLVLILAFIACTPPEEVRLQEYTEPAESGYFAHIPAGLQFCNLALGESFSETQESLNLSLELNRTSKEEYKIAQFSVQNNQIDADTIVACGFKNGRLSALVATTTFNTAFEDSQKMLEALSSIYESVSDLKLNFNTLKSANFWQVDDVVSVKYEFLQNQNGFLGLHYAIAYTSEIDIFQHLLNS